jgi:hypothetical protein
MLSDKTKAIITKCVVPLAVKQVLNYQKEAHFVLVIIDSSNLLNLSVYKNSVLHQTYA